ncbi:hypothetical protein [Verrucomicrobium sp. 3C]|uniref:hypothetical protein n=1 Tax=Verrucomicrobium sp. 3C TaxID=1134055 RepID=UPI00037BCB04|nr:hypothetical protein [Verrucomicrobium sp. 3C]
MRFRQPEARRCFRLLLLALGVLLLGATVARVHSAVREVRTWAIGPGRIQRAYEALPCRDGGLWLLASPVREEGDRRSRAELSRWEAGGRLLWARTIVDPVPIEIRFHLVSEPGGEVVVAGQSGGSFRMWRFSEEGELLWGQRLVADPANANEVVTADGKGGLYICLHQPPAGRVRSDRPEISEGATRIFHYSEKGSLLRSYTFDAVPQARQPGARWLPSGPLGIQNPIGMAAYPTGGIAVAGYYAGLSGVPPGASQGVSQARLDYGWLSSGGLGGPEVKIFVDRWDESGQRLWTRLLGRMWNTLAFAVATSPNGEVAVAGSSEWGACSAGRPLRPGGLRLFVAAFGSDRAAPGWCREIAENLSIGPMALCYGADGGLWVLGEAKGPLISSEPLSLGGRVFLAKLDSAGRPQWRHQLGDGTSRPFAHIERGPEGHRAIAWATAALGSRYRSQEGEIVSVGLFPEALP